MLNLKCSQLIRLVIPLRRNLDKSFLFFAVSLRIVRVCCSRVNGEIANKCANVKGKIYANVSGQIYTNINDQIYANVNYQIYANMQM